MSEPKPNEDIARGPCFTDEDLRELKEEIALQGHLHMGGAQLKSILARLDAAEEMVTIINAYADERVKELHGIIGQQNIALMKARNEALEEAAKIADIYGETVHGATVVAECRNIAQGIRALKSPSGESGAHSEKGGL